MPSIYELQQSHLVIPYPGLDFIVPYSAGLVSALYGLAFAGASLLAFGILPRLGTLVFLLSFGYLFLIDISWYNNHYYL